MKGKVMNKIQKCLILYIILSYPINYMAMKNNMICYQPHPNNDAVSTEEYKILSLMFSPIGVPFAMLNQIVEGIVRPIIKSTLQAKQPPSSP